MASYIRQSPFECDKWSKLEGQNVKNLSPYITIFNRYFKIQSFTLQITPLTLDPLTTPRPYYILSRNRRFHAKLCSIETSVLSSKKFAYKWLLTVRLVVDCVELRSLAFCAYERGLRYCGTVSCNIEQLVCAKGYSPLTFLRPWCWCCLSLRSRLGSTRRRIVVGVGHRSQWEW